MAYQGLNNHNAMDTTRHLSVAELRQMRSQGINTVFRYLAGGGSWKQLNAQDVRNFQEAGMSLALIYQERGRAASDFTADEGREAARETIRRARELGLPDNAVMYFAVDYDASQGDVANNIIPYFRAVQEELRAQGSNIQIGVYGSGAVCEAVHGAGLAQRTWLAGASGWRGSQEFFRSGQWDVVQQIRGDRDYNTINPLTQGIGSVNFNQGRAYAQAMGPGASTVDPQTAARNLQQWLASGTTGDPEHDDTRDEFYRRTESLLGMNPDAVRDALEQGGPIAILLIFFMFLLMGADKMGEIGATGNSQRPNAPPSPETTSPFAASESPAPPQMPYGRVAGNGDNVGADLNGDGECSDADQNIFQQIMRGDVYLFRAPDVNSDGKFTMSDLATIRQNLESAGVVQSTASNSDVLQAFVERRRTEAARTQ